MNLSMGCTWLIEEELINRQNVRTLLTLGTSSLSNKHLIKDGHLLELAQFPLSQCNSANSKEQHLRTTSFPQQNNVAVQTLDMLKLSVPESAGDFFRMLTQADSSEKDAGMLGDTNQRALENLPADQQIIAPIGGIIRSSGKQPAVLSGRKRKTLLSSVASVGKEKAIVAGIAKDNT